MLRRMTSWTLFHKKTARHSDGARVYAIGDIHGCFEILVKLLQQIEKDQAGRDTRDTRLVFLGDYIDRGPQSRDVCELLVNLVGSDHICCLRGNHEQAMLDVLKGETEALRFWMRYGGVETLQSWGVSDRLIEKARMSEQGERRLIEAFQNAVPDYIVEWLEGLPLRYRVGDYLFVHAGIRPGVELEEQTDHDLMWIREPFLHSRAQHHVTVVHGHSEDEDPQVRSNRIGVDTGAYRTGVLTAVGIEDNTHWFVQTE
jgi:serine/threonine protein phosphatase 1